MIEQSQAVTPESASADKRVVELFVVPSDSVDCRPALDLLKAWAAQRRPAISLKIQPNPERLETSGQGHHVIVLHPGLKALVVGAMMEGNAPSAALAHAIEATAKMLACCRRLRRYLTVVDPHDVERGGDLFARLERRLGMSSNKRPAVSAAAASKMGDPAEAALLRILAGALMARSPEAVRLAAEIDAMTLSAGGNPERVNDAPDNAFLCYTTLKSRMSESVAKADLLAEQFGLMEQEILRQVSEHAAVSADLAATRNRLAALHASTSWRVTRPLRTIRRTMTGKVSADD